MERELLSLRGREGLASARSRRCRRGSVSIEIPTIEATRDELSDLMQELDLKELGTSLKHALNSFDSLMSSDKPSERGRSRSDRQSARGSPRRLVADSSKSPTGRRFSLTSLHSLLCNKEIQVCGSLWVREESCVPIISINKSLPTDPCCRNS